MTECYKIWEVDTMRVAFDEVKNTIKQALLNLGVTETEAEICAQIHTDKYVRYQ